MRSTMASMDARIFAASASSMTQCTVLRMRIGGSAGFRHDDCLAMGCAANLLQAARRGLGELVDILPRARAGAFAGDGGDDFGVLDRRDLFQGVDQRHGRLAAAAHEVDIVRPDMFIEIDQRDDVGTDGGGSQIDGDLVCLALTAARASYARSPS